jgi:hypothetical protein
MPPNPVSVIFMISITNEISLQFFLFFSSGSRAYAPDAPQPVGLLCCPSVLDVPLSPPVRLLVHVTRETPSSERWELRGRESWPIILLKCSTSTEHLGFFYMPQINDMGPTALLPLRRKACWGFFSPLKVRRLWPGLNPRTWVLKASTLPLDHWSRFLCS